MQSVTVSDCGDIIRMCYHPCCSRWDSEAARRSKKKWTRKAWQKMNDRKSWERLEDRIACNFTYEDWHAVFTLNSKYNTRDYEKLRGYWRSSLRRLKKMVKARGGKSPAYIYVCEGLHGDERLHVHALIDRECTEDEIRSCWPYGEEKYIWRLGTFEHRDHMGRYLTKEPRKFGRDRLDRNQYVASHNCVKPSCRRYRIPEGQELPCPDGFVQVFKSEEGDEFGQFLYKVYRRIHS